MEQNKPFTNEEFQDMAINVNEIRSFIKEELVHMVWHWYCKIEGKELPKPCTCASAAGQWKKAVDTIREYIKNNSDKYND